MSAPTWRLAPGVRWLDPCTLAGGAPYRVITLTTRGAGVLTGLLNTADEPASPAQREVLDRLQTAGLVLAPPPAAGHGGVTVVIPARSAPGPVAVLLGRLPADLPVIVVDDGSPEPLLPLLSGRDGLTVIRHDRSRGPAAARNAGAAGLTTEWIAFLDADTVPQPDWIAELLGRVERDERAGGAVALAAPRIWPLPGSGRGAWFEERVCALDLGGVPSEVGVGRPVSYVPSAAMLVRTAAFRAVGGFDEQMIVGEDVDLVWRLATQGRIRYLPDVRVAHRPRGSLRAALLRRVDYGCSAVDLGRRHPGALRHVDVSAWSFGPWLLGVLVHPLIGAAAAAGTAAIAPWGMRGLSARHARSLAGQGHLRAGGALGRWLVRPMLPATVLIALAVPRVGRRLLVTAAAGLGYLISLDLRQARVDAAADIGSDPDPDRAPRSAGRLAVESLVARTLDDAAYSLGVWRGVITRRTIDPLLPRVRDLPRWMAGPGVRHRDR